jgi:hypothetical protein
MDDEALWGVTSAKRATNLYPVAVRITHLAPSYGAYHNWHHKEPE